MATRPGPYVYPPILQPIEEVLPDRRRWLNWMDVHEVVGSTFTSMRNYMEVVFSCGRRERVNAIIGGDVVLTDNETYIDRAWFNNAIAEIGFPQMDVDRDFVNVPVPQIRAASFPGIMYGLGEVDTHIVDMRAIAQVHRQWQEHLHGPCPYATVLPEAYKSLKCIAALMPDPTTFFETALWGLEVSEFVFLAHLNKLDEMPGYPGPLPGIPQFYEERLFHAGRVLGLVGDHIFYLKHAAKHIQAYEDFLGEWAENHDEEISKVMTVVQLNVHMDNVVRMWARRHAAIIRLSRRFMHQEADDAGQDLSTMVDICHTHRPITRPTRRRNFDVAVHIRLTLYSQAYPTQHHFSPQLVLHGGTSSGRTMRAYIIELEDPLQARNRPQTRMLAIEDGTVGNERAYRFTFPGGSVEPDRPRHLRAHEPEAEEGPSLLCVPETRDDSGNHRSIEDEDDGAPIFLVRRELLAVALRFPRVSSEEAFFGDDIVPTEPSIANLTIHATTFIRPRNDIVLEPLYPNDVYEEVD